MSNSNWPQKQRGVKSWVCETFRTLSACTQSRSLRLVLVLRTFLPRSLISRTHCPLAIGHWPLADNIVERQNAAKVSKEVLVQIAIIAVDGKKEEKVEKATKINISLFYYLSLESELCQSSPFCFHWTRVRSVPGLVSNLISNSFCHVVES